MKYTKLKIITLIMAFVMIGMFAGCAQIQGLLGISDNKAESLLENSVKTLEISQAFYTTVLGEAGKLHCAGQINDATAIKIINAAGNYYFAHQKAAELVQKWNAGDVNYKISALDAISILRQESGVLGETVRAMTGKTITSNM